MPILTIPNVPGYGMPLRHSPPIPSTARASEGWTCIPSRASHGRHQNAYFDHRWGTIDETLALDRLQKGVSKTARDLGAYLRHGMGDVPEEDWEAHTEGSLRKDAKRAAEGSGYPYVAQFAIMDGVVGEDSFGLLAPDYTMSALGVAIVTA